MRPAIEINKTKNKTTVFFTVVLFFLGYKYWGRFTRGGEKKILFLYKKRLGGT